MPTSPGLAFVVGLNLVVLVVVVAVVYWYRSAASRPTPDPDAWRRDVAVAAGDLRDALEAYDRTSDTAGVDRVVLPRVGRFERLVREAPEGVDEALLRRVHELGVACRRLGFERPHRADLLSDPAEGSAVDDLLERAGRVAADASPGEPGDLRA